MRRERSVRPSLPGIALSLVLGLLIGVGLAFPEVSRHLPVVLDILDDLGRGGTVAVIGSLAIVPLMTGLFVLWRTSRGAH